MDPGFCGELGWQRSFDYETDEFQHPITLLRPHEIARAKGLKSSPFARCKSCADNILSHLFRDSRAILSGLWRQLAQVGSGAKRGIGTIEIERRDMVKLTDGGSPVFPLSFYGLGDISVDG